MTATEAKRYKLDRFPCECGSTLIVQHRRDGQTLRDEYRVICQLFNFSNNSVYHCQFVPTDWCDSHEAALQLWRVRELMEHPA